MESNVLTICEIPSSIDLEKLKSYVKKYMEPRLEFHDDNPNDGGLSLEAKYSEWWTARASSGKRVGMGSGGTDVKTSNNEGIDVMCVLMNKRISGEKSLVQNFKNSGSDLDTLFKTKNYETAVKLYMEGFKKKLNIEKEKHDLSDMYIMAYISTKTDISICCFKIDLSVIEAVKPCKATNVNITINGIIDNKYGTSTLYKSKKRVELRLSIKCLDDPLTVKIYSRV